MVSDKALAGEILTLLDRSLSWLLISHEKPDGDTLGCAAALTRLGMRLSKRVMAICKDPCFEKYSFLMDGLDFKVTKRMPEDFPGRDGVIVCVDTCPVDRSYPELRERAFSCPVVNIDHHADNELYGDVNWIDPTASATGEMVTSLMAFSQWGIRADEAEALYVAVISDNGGFSFPSTTLDSHQCAITLLKAGASPNLIAEKLHSTLTVNTLNLWGRAFSRAEVFSGGDCAIYWLEKNDFTETKSKQDATENLVNFLLRIKRVKMAALCSEQPGREGEHVRVSLRSRPPFIAREVAVIFGGGGHDMASGCTINAPLSEAVATLREEMARHVSGISANL